MSQSGPDREDLPPWRDEPVDATADTLGRQEVSANMAVQVRTLHSWDSSVVFGLTGPWGSGKSSMINMVIDELSKPVQDQQPWAISRFTPWSAGDSEALIREFYLAVAEHLPSTGEARKKLLTLAVVASPLLKSIPIAGGGLADISKDLFSKGLAEKPWQVVFDEACEALQRERRPLLIVADDVDRLHTDELMVLLKVVRLLGRFPGVFYLLAYDEETLLGNLRQAGVGGPDTDRARQFMEKIVQYQLPVPSLTEQQILERLDEELVAALNDGDRQVPDEQYARLSSLSEALEAQLTTPRAIGRFVAHVRMHLALLPVGEVNDVDLILLTLIRVQFPDLYRALPSWSRELTGGVKTRSYLASFGKDRPQPEWEKLMGTVAERHREDAREVMEELFPVMGRRFVSHARAQGISDADYFARYFAQGIPEDDVSDAQLERLLDDAELRGADSDLTRFLATGKHARTDLTLRKLAARTTAIRQPSRSFTLGLFQALLAARPNLDTNGINAPRDRATYWLSFAARRLAPNVGAEALLATLTNNTDLSTALEVVWGASRLDPHTNEPPPHEVRVIAERLAGRAVQALMVGLRRRDDDDVETPYAFYVRFAAKYSDAAATADQLRDLFATTEVTVEDFAARCVTISTIMGVVPIRRLHGFDHSSFSLLIPAGEPFLDLPLQQGLNTVDLTWANRRAYSHGRPGSNDADYVDDVDE